MEKSLLKRNAIAKEWFGQNIHIAEPSHNSKPWDFYKTGPKVTSALAYEAQEGSLKEVSHEKVFLVEQATSIESISRVCARH